MFGGMFANLSYRWLIDCAGVAVTGVACLGGSYPANRTDQLPVDVLVGQAYYCLIETGSMI